MRFSKTAVVAVLSLLGLRGVMAAQSIPGYTLQEVILVPVNGASVTSQSTLTLGVSYKLRAMGSVDVNVPGVPQGMYLKADAEYAFDFNRPFFSGPPVSNCPFGHADIGLAVNNATVGASKTPSWGSFNPAHTYTADFTGTGASININYHNCIYSGSQGLLTVEILRPMAMLLPTIVPPSYTNVSPEINTFPFGVQSVSGRANALAVSSDGKRLYAGTFAGVWRSDDGGVTWRQMTQQQPAQGINAVPGALLVPDVIDIAISPQNPDVVMVGAIGDLHAQRTNGIFRSEDGGNTWTLVKRFTCSNGGAVTQIVFAPDNPNLVFAAAGCAVGISENGGKTWAEKALPSQTSAFHVAVASFEPPQNKLAAITATGTTPPLGIRRVYALGAKVLLYSIDGGQTWTKDTGFPTVSSLVDVGDIAVTNNGNSSRVIMVEPGNNLHVLLAAPGRANGPSYYDNPQCGSMSNIPDGAGCNTSAGRPCGEGSVWLGDFSGFVPSDPARQAAAWRQLPGPPVYHGGSTPSGNVYVDLKPVGNSYLLFLSDMSHMHVSAGLPARGAWHRIDGVDASQAQPPGSASYCNHVLTHADPHALALASDFSMALQPTRSPAPFNQNKEAAAGASGAIWMANDGGVFHSVGSSPKWRPSAGLSTLAVNNIAGLAVKGLAPALYFGTGDNNTFFSLDGGNSWSISIGACGDCDEWAADPAINQVVEFMPKAQGGGFFVFTNKAKYPDAGHQAAADTTFAHWVCPNDCNVVSEFWIRGYRPMVLTPDGATPPVSGDYIVIGTKSDGSRVVFRKTNDVLMQTPSDWEDPAKAVQYGPPLPPCPPTIPDCIDVVQASGGHAAPVLYAGDPDRATTNDIRGHFRTLWKWAPGMPAWQQIVPSPSTTPPTEQAQHANRFFVDPFNPNTIYLLDDTAIRRSDDGGVTWPIDVNLDNAITENHRFSYFGDISVIKDMIFVRGEKGTHFAVGSAGVFFTLNGSNWTRLLSTSAFPSHPVSAYFDNISDACDRALYVAIAGRGVLRIDPIPLPSRTGTTVVPCGQLTTKP
jgi:photosystem II stability/assembly factor-like uncharacterized protein